MIPGISDKPESLAASLASGQQRQATEAVKTAAQAEPPPAPAPKSAAQQVDVNDPSVQEAVEKVNSAMQEQTGDRLSLSVDRDTNRVIVRYKDPQSGEVVRQFPPETILKMVKQLDKLKGTMLDFKG